MKLVGLKEMQTVETEIIKLVQIRYFGKEIVLLSKKKKLEVNNRLFKLDPYVDVQGVLRVGGKMQKSLILQEIQHPGLLPEGLQSHKFDSAIARRIAESQI